jgi:hypothetical protein
LSVRPSIRKLVLPDWQTLHDELISHKHLTLMLLWQEYKLILLTAIPLRSWLEPSKLLPPFSGHAV